ncbi:transaldolase family protein [Rhodobacteraceae bacterium nBUS_24]
MRLYLDTADSSDWRDLMPMGVFYGITTNPLLTDRAGLRYRDISWKDLAQTAADLGAKEFHAQVYGNMDQSLKFAEQIYAIGQSVGIECVVKIPLSVEGISIAPKIKSMGGKILLTACYDAKQMITATALEADYIAPYFGRMKEAGLDAMAHLRAMKEMSQNGSCRTLVASLRSAQQMVEIAQLGHDCFTISPTVARDLFQSDLTDVAVANFEQSAVGELS